MAIFWKLSPNKKIVTTQNSSRMCFYIILGGQKFFLIFQNFSKKIQIFRNFSKKIQIWENKLKIPTMSFVRVELKKEKEKNHLC